MKRFLSLALTLVMAFAFCSCGTVFHGDRRDKQASHQIDVLTFTLDCCGLILGIVPGVISLIVDYSNDTIYYSVDELKNKAELSPSTMKSIHVTDMSREGIAKALSKELGRPIAPESIVF